MRRRALLGGLLAAPLAGTAATLSGCAAPADPTANLWHRGELAIGTGNTTGVFYEIGAGYADVINRHLPRYEAVAAATGGSVDNLNRLGSGDIDIALAQVNNAADAVHGTGPWLGKPVALRALARLYNNYGHVIVRADANIRQISDLAGRRVSSGAHPSGTEVMAIRMLTAAGLDPDKGVVRLPMSLPETTDAMVAGSIDAMIWSGGLPTTGITDLFNKAGNKVRFLAVDGLLPQLDKLYGTGIYTKVNIAKGTYNLPGDVPTVAEPNLLVAATNLPADLVYQLTSLLFTYRSELAAVHPEANNIKRDTATMTDPVPLHDGARRYYGA
jgi:TRAP transporter TAXI family solute receptor